MEKETKRTEYSEEEKARLIESKREHFAAVRKECADEFDAFRPCVGCWLLSPSCHKGCGVIMKHLSRMRGR